MCILQILYKHLFMPGAFEGLDHGPLANDVPGLLSGRGVLDLCVLTNVQQTAALGWAGFDLCVTVPTPMLPWDAVASWEQSSPSHICCLVFAETGRTWEHNAACAPKRLQVVVFLLEPLHGAPGCVHKVRSDASCAR